MKKKVLAVILALTLLITLFTACNREPRSTDGSAAAGEDAMAGDKLRVALVVNQRFGDNSVSDFIAAGVTEAAEKYDMEVKLFESTSSANHEEDIRAMAKAGYGLILTTFPYMSDATRTVAEEYPKANFVAIFQTINTPEKTYPNIWDMEFNGQEAMYINGYIAGKYTKTNRIGLVIGGEEPSPNAEGNGFMQGVLAANPDATVDFAFVGSYEDPAKAKEIASAMLLIGCDIIQTDSAASDTGVVEASKDSGTLVMGVISDYSYLYDGFAGVIEMDFQGASYEAVERFAKDEFPGGEHGIRNLENRGYYMAWNVYEKFIAGSTEHGADFAEIVAEAKTVEEKIISGEIVVPFDPAVPNWDRIKG